MKMKKRICSVVLVFVLVAASLTGCGSSKKSTSGGDGADTGAAGGNVLSAQESSEANESVTSTDPFKKEVHIAVSASPSTLDVMNNDQFLIRQIVDAGQVYEKLVTLDANGEAQLELAEKYETSSDNKVWTYYLRKGVKFHNGEEMTAKDVVASLNRWITCVGIASDLCGDSKFEEVDDYTVEIKLKKGSANFNILMGGSSPSAVITPASVIENSLDEKTGFLTEYIGTGPYKFVEWQTDKHILLEKNADYTPYGTEGEYSGWGGYKTAYTEKIYYEIVPDSATRVAGIQSGEYDMLYVPCPLDNFDQLAAMDNLSLIQENRGNLLLTYNKKNTACKQKEVRQAINMILDMDQIMRASFGDSKFYTISNSIMFDENSPFYTEAGKEYFNTKDIEGAKKLLADSGFDLSTPIQICCPTDYTEYYNAGLNVSEQLKNAGLTVELVTQDWASICNLTAEESGWDIFICTYGPYSIPSAADYMSGSGIGTGFPDDSKLTELQNKILFAEDSDSAKKTWEELQTYLISDYVPVTSAGPWKSYSVIAGKYDMSFNQGGIMWNAKFYE